MVAAVTEAQRTMGGLAQGWEGGLNQRSYRDAKVSCACPQGWFLYFVIFLTLYAFT